MRDIGEDFSVAYQAYIPRGKFASSMDTNQERFALNGVVQAAKEAAGGKLRLLEIGTFLGVGMVQFRRMDKDAELHTLNILPEQADRDAPGILDKGQIGKIAKFECAKHFQHYGDSVKFDYSIFKDFGMVYVDGDPRNVGSDTASALAILSPGGYVAWRGVEDKSPKREAIHAMESWFQDGVSRVKGTSLAFARKAAT